MTAPASPPVAVGVELAREALENILRVTGMTPQDVVMQQRGIAHRALEALSAAPMEAVAWREKVAAIIDGIEVVTGAHGPRIRPGERVRATNAILQALALIPQAEET